MKSIPEGMRPYRRTAVFTQDSIPKGLLRGHTTKPGTWATIVVLSGELQYSISGAPPEVLVLTPERPGIVEEAVIHEIAPLGAVEFYVEFYKMPDAADG